MLATRKSVTVAACAHANPHPSTQSYLGGRAGQPGSWTPRDEVSTGELGRQRIVWVGFDVLQSNWPLRISFPIFIANAVEWLDPANARNGQLLVKAGDPFRLALLEPQTDAQVTLPDGATKALKLDPTAKARPVGMD